jgi:hypothetical protein
MQMEISEAPTIDLEWFRKQNRIPIPIISQKGFHFCDAKPGAALEEIP